MNIEHVQAVDLTITSRHSVRAFLDQPLDTQLIKDILNVACRAPSGSNTQPWKVFVVSGKKRQELIDRVCALQVEIIKQPELAQRYTAPFAYYPSTWISPFIDRRRENGWGLYGLLNIQKADKEKIAAQHLRNYQLFDAPVILYFTVNKIMQVGSKMDISMMVQNVMIAAKARGIDSCPQAAWNPFQELVLEILGADDDQELVCAVVLGYADPNHIVNTFITPREPVEQFSVFLD